MTPALAVTREPVRRVIPELGHKATQVRPATRGPVHRVILGLALREIQELARKAIQELVILGLLVTRARQVIRELVTRVQRVPQAIKATLELGILARQAIPGLLATQELATLENRVTQGPATPGLETPEPKATLALRATQARPLLG